ncbi:MAG: RnfABCDGE type electron transport complex subunit G [Synergistes sp.]|nr:RnfABCDGE type electron transport complex subunit G [Synergistes sp.]
MGKIIKLGVVLLLITAVTGLILGFVYTKTLEPIKAAKEQEKNEAFTATLPGAETFGQIKLKGDSGIITEIYEGKSGGNVVGYNFTVTPKGYGGILQMIVGISNEGKVKNIKILSHSETPGLGAKAADEAFSGQYKDKPADALSVTKTPPTADTEIQAISGATITSTAVTNGVNEAVAYWKANLSSAAAQN